ncbi:MAG: TolC family protein [Ignavibacteriaceae bacterium]
MNNLIIKPKPMNKRQYFSTGISQANFWFVIIFIIGFIQNICAQPVDSLVAEAIQNNPKLKSLKYNVQSADYRSQSVNALPPPTLGIEFNQIQTGKYDLWNDALSNTLSLSQMFMLGGKLNAMADVEKKNALISGDDYQAYKINLSAQVKMEYYTLWLFDKKIDVEEADIKLLNELINSVTILYQVNKINQADLLTLKSEVASNKTQLLILQNQKEAETYKLNKLLGRDLDSKGIYTEKEIHIDSLNSSMNELQSKLEEMNPSLKKMDNMIDMNIAMENANEKDLVPDLMVQGMIMRMPQGMILTEKSDLSMLMPQTQYMYSLMASITLPFAPWSVNKFKAKDEEILSDIKGIEYDKVDMHREMVSGLKNALVKYKTSTDLIKLNSTYVIPLYKQAVEAQISAYQNNRTNINAVIDASRMLLMQEMNFYMAQADHQMSLAEIEMMIGTELK